MLPRELLRELCLGGDDDDDDDSERPDEMTDDQKPDTVGGIPIRWMPPMLLEWRVGIVVDVDKADTNADDALCL